MDIIEYTSPYNYKNYEFVTTNCSDIPESLIRYAEININRAEKQLELSNILNNIHIALKMELSIFEYSLIYCVNNGFEIDFIKPVYDDKYYNILVNINGDKKINNMLLRKNLINNIIDPCYVAFMTSSQLHPDKWSECIKKKLYKEQRENNISYSDAYKCFRCGESKCKISQAQTRSADEPMTTFVTCIVCNNTFKFC